MKDLSLEAALEYVSPKAVETNGANQFEIKAAVHSSGSSNIRSGYSANAEIVLSQAKHVMTVPESAIVFEGKNTYVYVIKGSGKDKKYIRRRVVTGLSDGLMIEIKSGLTLKDKVRGPKKVADDNKDDEQ
jgi:HlyD family secretion protein